MSKLGQRWESDRTLNWIRGLTVLFTFVGIAALWSLAFEHTYADPPHSGTTYTPEPVAPRAPTLDEARRLMASGEPVNISILGDSTGSDPGEWVDLWAQMLGSDHRVRLHWRDGANGYKPDPTVYGSTGPIVNIWNFAQPGGSANYPAGRLRQAQPVRPDLVIYSFGHNNDASTLRPQLDETYAAVRSRWGTVPTSVAIEQNPARGAAEDKGIATRRSLYWWADAVQVPVISVATAFDARNPGALMVDEYHPNPAGSALWARVVAQALS